jgi:amino acid transporter
LPAVLADDGYLPSALTRRTKVGAVPWASVLVCSVAWTATLGLSFERLVCLDILLYGGSLALEFIALVVLRVREPDLPRPFRVPGGLPAAVLLGVGPMALLAFALVKSSGETLGGMNALLFGVIVVALGPVLYRVTRPKPAAQMSTAE